MRRESLISPWGVGAIVPFPHDESLMVAGIDYWFDKDHTYEDFLIADERLTKRLGGKQFVWPPDFRKKSQDKDNAEMKIPAVRFPLWHYCPVCGNMEIVGSSGSKVRCRGDIRKESQKDKYCAKNSGKKGLPLLVPERFIAVCEDGHIEDFPIMEWVHAKSNKPITSSCKLIRSTGGSSSALSGIRYKCTCEAQATMGGAFSTGALDRIGYVCTGNSPWLESSAKQSCDKSLFVLQRGASNVWFADIISSVYIPWLPKYKNQATKRCVEDGIKIFRSQRINGEIDEETIKRFVRMRLEFERDVDEICAVSEIIATLNNAIQECDVAQTDDEYRKQEYDVLTSTVGKADDELFCKNYSAMSYANIPYIKSISLVHKLRETRVFLGFKRIKPDVKSRARISLKDISWLPAIKNSGEGIMFEFDIDKLKVWALKPKVIERVRIIELNLRNSNKISNEEINPIYVLLHTFAHCLITTLSNECGYSNASIREKIYCGKYLNNNIEMAGILIYTASGDSEGSLGGLVRQGMKGRIENIIRRAINDTKWCTSDPVCIQSPGQGQNGCNLAACHNCALLPETSCENKNALLDRGLMVGTLNDKEIGFFNAYEEQ